MAKTKISEYSQTSSQNTDINSININEGCPPSTINNAIRELMKQVKDFQVGAQGDGLTVAGNLVVVGTATVPTPTPGTNNTQVATTAFVASAVTGATGSLGTMSSQNANNVTVTGGSITGITDLAVADGGTGRSSLTANNLLIGNGASAVNFVAPGTNGNVLTSNGTTWSSTALPAAPPSVGVGQTWQDVSGSRSLGTTYTNSTGKPILVLVRTGNNSLSATIGGVSLGVIAANQSGGSGGQNVAVIVPDTATYAFTSSGSLQNWSELR